MQAGWMGFWLKRHKTRVVLTSGVDGFLQEYNVLPWVEVWVRGDGPVKLRLLMGHL